MVFDDWKEAHTHAVLQARKLGLDCGVEKINEFGKTRYAVRYLPKPENRCGFELRCEVVKVTDPL